MTAASPSSHPLTFFRSGGVDQVMLRTGADLAAVEHLDLKLWMALAMPTRGIECDPRTADLLDTDGDGRIRPPELIAALRWAREAFRSLDDLVRGGDAVPLAAIASPDLLSAARRILADLGKPSATAISLEDVADKQRLIAAMRFNGDGIIPPESADDPAVRQALADIVAALGGEPDAGGQVGVSRAKADAFFEQADAVVAWSARAESDLSGAGLTLDALSAARAAIQAVKVKLDDYFARCRVAAFDPRAVGALNRDPAAYDVLGRETLTLASETMAALPLGSVAAGRPLPLEDGVNPAWSDAVAALRRDAVAPLLGDREALSEDDWRALQAKLAPLDAWLASRPDTPVAALGVPRLRELLAGDARKAIQALLDQDLAAARDTSQFAAVEKLLRFQRDVYAVLTNMINFAAFYRQREAFFQAGTLYLDARACALCIEVADPDKHALLAGLSGAFLAYCQATRPGGQKRTIVAVFTNGDSDNLMVGRNGVFYDRQGRDWDATIVKIVANPISVREAFWLPYKKFVRFVEDQVAKRAQTAEAASTEKMAGIAATTQSPAAAVPKKLDLGTIALIGTAVGGISALVGGFLQALFGLGFWLPLGLLGIMLLISGPSMILAWLKLRARNLGPILDANGWAVNTRAKLNVPFGAALTSLARLPPGSRRLLADPYARRRRPSALLLAALLAALLAFLWMGASGRLCVPAGAGAPCPAASRAP